MIHDVTAPIRSYLTAAPAEVRITSFSLKSTARARRNQDFSKDNTCPFCWVFKRENSTTVPSPCFFNLLATTNTTSAGRQKGQHVLAPGTASQSLVIASHSCLMTALKELLRIFKSKQTAVQARSDALLPQSCSAWQVPPSEMPSGGRGQRGTVLTKERLARPLLLVAPAVG